MKLYDSRRAPNPRRVRWFMAEKGIENIEVIDVDLFKGEHRDAGYLAKAGAPNVPPIAQSKASPAQRRLYSTACAEPGQLPRASPSTRTKT